MSESSATVPARVALMIETNGPGGAENMLVHLAAGLRRRGIEACPVIPASDGSSWLEQRFRESGFVPETFTIARPLDLAALRSLRRLLTERDIQLVHSHEFTMAVYGRVASRLARRPHVVTMHGGTAFAARARRRVALGWALRRSEARVAVSDTTAEFLASSCRVERRSIDVIPNGVDVHAGDGRRVRAELGLGESGIMVLAVGNLYRVKGHRVLIEAAAQLRDLREQWIVAIAGRGEEEAALRNQIVAAGLGDRVRLLGLRSDIPDLLAAADVFVMPSLSEGLPLALLEAMASGKPVVASAVGGIPTVVREAESGYLVPPSDVAALGGRIAELLMDGGLRRRLGDGARADVATRFGVAQMTDAYIQVYQRALRRRD